MISQWEVWFADFPYEEDITILKKRPVIILNVQPLEVLSVKVTSQEIRNNDKYDTPIKHWKYAGLDRPSVARVSKTQNLSSDNFLKKLGDIHNDDKQIIMENFMKFIEENQNK